MANHCFVTTRKRFKYEAVTADLQEINERRFNGALLIEPYEATESNYGNGWMIGVVGCHDWLTINCWLTTSRKFELRHGPGGDIRWWFEFCIQNDLALKYDGWTSDEGVEGRWKGEENYLPTFVDHVKKMHEHTSPGNVMFFLNANLKQIPPELREKLGDKMGEFPEISKEQENHWEEQLKAVAKEWEERQ
jgi:hypothetical protein